MASTPTNIKLIYDNNLSKQDNIIVIDNSPDKMNMYINLHLESSDFVGLQYQMEYLKKNYINNQGYTDYNIYITADGNSRIFINYDNKTVTIYKKNDFPKNKNTITINFTRNVYSDEKTNKNIETDKNRSVSTGGVRLITSQFAKFLEYNSDLIDWVLYFPKDDKTKPEITGSVFFSTDGTIINVPNKSILPLKWFSDHGLRTLDFGDDKKIGSLNMLGESKTEGGKSYNWAEYIDKDQWDKFLMKKFDNIKTFRNDVINAKKTETLDRKTYINNLLKTYNENIKTITSNSNDNIDLLLETHYIKFILDLIDNHPRWDNDYKNKNIELYEPKLIGKPDETYWFPFPPSGITKKYFSDTHLRDIQIMNIHLPPGIHIDDIVTYNKYSNVLLLKENINIDELIKKVTVGNMNYTQNLLTEFINNLKQEIIENKKHTNNPGLKVLVQRDFYFCFKFYSDLINNKFLKENIFEPLYITISGDTSDTAKIIKEILGNYNFDILGLQEVDDTTYNNITQITQIVNGYDIYSLKNIGIDIDTEPLVLNQLTQDDDNYEYTKDEHKMIFSKNKSLEGYNTFIKNSETTGTMQQYKDNDKIYTPTKTNKDTKTISLQKTFGVIMIKKTPINNI